MSDDKRDPHGLKLKEYYDPERGRIHVVVSTSKNPHAMVGTEKRYTDKQQFPLDFRQVKVIKPLILLHETMIMAYVHLYLDALHGEFINRWDGTPFRDYDELRAKVHEYEKMIGHFFVYDYSDDTVTVVKTTPETQEAADLTLPQYRAAVILKEQT